MTLITRLFIAVLFLFPAIAFGQQAFPRDITLSWTNPDSYVPVAPATVGEPIAPGDLESIRVECFRNSETTPAFTRVVPDTGEGQPQSETFVGVIPQPGTYRCFAYATVVGGAESDPSNEALRKFTGKPLPPQTFE
jgi:hypothetical protein